MPFLSFALSILYTQFVEGIICFRISCLAMLEVPQPTIMNQSRISIFVRQFARIFLECRVLKLTLPFVYYFFALD